MKPLVRLHAIADDRERVEQFADILRRRAYKCEVEIETPSHSGANATDNFSEPETHLEVRDVICWTTASVGVLGKGIHERARVLKERNAYFGLLLDEVSPPLIVHGAQDLSLAALENTTDSASREALLATLDRRIEGADTKRNWWSMLHESTLALHRIASRIDTSISSFKKVAVIAAFSGVLGIITSVLSWQDPVCRIGALHRPCRFLHFGHLPSEREEIDWGKAKVSSDCERFDHYLRTYGPHSAYAAEAQQRLNLKRDVAATYPKQILISYSVPYADTPSESQAAAVTDLVRREATDAIALCSRNAQAFSGEYAHGRFAEDAAQPTCDERAGGYVCRARGELQCSFLMPTTKSLCSPS